MLPDMLRRTVLLMSMLSAASAEGRLYDFVPREFNIYLSGGKNSINVHGNSRFRTLHFEVAGQSAHVNRWIPRADIGAAISYHAIRQPSNFFGRQYGDSDQWAHALSTFFFVRRRWRETASTQPYLEVGTGPMYSNRPVPAATSRLNFDSQLGFGAVLFSQSRVPLHIGYRFAHISNGLFHARNPGLNTHSAIIGVRLTKLGSGR